MKRSSKRSAFTIVEILTAAVITTVILGAVVAATMALQRSFLGNRAYTKSIADSARVVDYITRDLRNATAISRRTSSASSPFKTGVFEITANDQLCVFVPNYYKSNIPETTGYNSPIYSRENLNGQPYYLYDDVVTVVGTTRIPKYPSTLEIRYEKRARSASDPTVCYFRTEIEGGTVRQTEEIAERANGQILKINAPGLYTIQVISSFDSYWSGEKYRDSSRQFSTVYLENTRTDERL